MLSPKPIRRIMLIFPPIVFDKLQSRQAAVFPLGLAYIAAVLEKEYEVSILDASLEGYDNVQKLSESKYVYGLSDEQIKEAIRSFDPQVVGISCIYSTLHNQTLKVAKCAKEVNPNIITITGGAHPSAVPERMLKDKNLDFCVIGEGEYSTLELMNKLSKSEDFKNIDGIAYKKNRRVIINPKTQYIQNLDELPFPAWHLVKIERYLAIGKNQGLRMDGKRSKPLRIIQVFSSRGCPNNCSYCGTHAVWGYLFRTRSAKNVLDEIEILANKYKIERITFNDDNLTLDRKRTIEIFDGMIERGINITWEANNGLQLSTLDDEILEKMKASGCAQFYAAIESGTPEILRKVRKHMDFDAVPKIVKKAKEMGIDVRGAFIIGFPNETREQIQNTIEISRSLNLSESKFGILTPYPGSPLYKECVDKGLINENKLDFETLSNSNSIQLSHVPSEELLKIRKIEWIKNVFADEKGNLKLNLPITKKLMLEELKNGLKLYPDSKELKKLYEQAVKIED